MIHVYVRQLYVRNSELSVNISLTLLRRPDASQWMQIAGYVKEKGGKKAEHEDKNNPRPTVKSKNDRALGRTRNSLFFLNYCFCTLDTKTCLFFSFPPSGSVKLLFMEGLG